MTKLEFKDLTSDHRAVVLLSGGLDSTVLLAGLVRVCREVRAVSFFYGQKHSTELEAAKKVAQFFDVDHVEIDISTAFSRISQVSSSALLTLTSAIPEGHYAAETMKQTIVPNRNMILSSIAAGYAAALDFDFVAIAAHAGDHPIYPDCRPEFLDSLDRTISLATERVRVFAPFTSFSKADIVASGDVWGAPLHLTWSCYKGGTTQCGACGTCVERIEAFIEAGIVDPTEYSNKQFALEALDEWGQAHGAS